MLVVESRWVEGDALDHAIASEDRYSTSVVAVPVSATTSRRHSSIGVNSTSRIASAEAPSASWTAQANSRASSAVQTCRQLGAPTVTVLLCLEADRQCNRTPFGICPSNMCRNSSAKPHSWPPQEPGSVRPLPHEACANNGPVVGSTIFGSSSGRATRKGSRSP